MRRLHDKLSKNLMATHSRLWVSVMKDVGALRNMLTEVYVMQTEVRFFALIGKSIFSDFFSLFLAGAKFPQRQFLFSVVSRIDDVQKPKSCVVAQTVGHHTFERRYRRENA